MKRILLSLLILSATGALAFGVSRAFFSDTETSTGNTFTAGAIDLKVDNTSYLNSGVDGVMVSVPSLTWTATDLVNELFFNFADIKPGDLGEDTVSLLVTSNPAWVCADIDVTANDDVTCTEPELDDEPGCTAPGTGLGELADQLNFIFWADDGDNVLEEEEQVLTQGPASAVLNGVTWALADSQHNVWGVQGPMEPNVTKYIGKAWCFGELTVPVERFLQEETGDPTTRGAGVLCNGSQVDNAAQTDKLMGDIVFRAVQARHNENFVCQRPNLPPVNDYLDIGDTASEAGHNLLGWSDAWVSPGWGGNYGGGSIDTSLRLLMGHGDGCLGAEDATFTMNAGAGLATKLTLEHLDGQVNDSFDVYINNVLASHYTGVSVPPNEVWKKTAFTFPGVTGTVNVKLDATNLVGDWCANWGQVAFSNALLE